MKNWMNWTPFELNSVWIIFITILCIAQHRKDIHWFQWCLKNVKSATKRGIIFLTICYDNWQFVCTELLNFYSFVHKVWHMIKLIKYFWICCKHYQFSFWTCSFLRVFTVEIPSFRSDLNVKNDKPNLQRFSPILT